MLPPVEGALIEFASPAPGQADTDFRAWYRHVRIPEILKRDAFEDVTWLAAAPVVFGFPLPEIDYSYLTIFRFRTPGQTPPGDLADAPDGHDRPPGVRLATRLHRLCTPRQGEDGEPGGIIAVYSDPVRGREADYHHWYARYHIPERLSRPAFRAASVFEVMDGSAAQPRWPLPQSHLAVWEIDARSIADLESIAAGSRAPAPSGDTPTDALDVPGARAQGYLRIDRSGNE